MTREEKCQMAIKKGVIYNEITGEVFGVKGKVLKTKDSQGYICFGIWNNGYTYKLYGHQFAWFVMYNECIESIDHINQIKTDNRKENLRKATRQLNSLNRKSRGVTFDKSRGKWISQIMINGKNKNLGRFNTAEEAEEKYNEFKVSLIKTII